MLSYYQELSIATEKSFALYDISEKVQALVNESSIDEGMLTLSSLHTTCALTVNENEERLFDDIESFFLKLAPAVLPYKHNDLHLRVNIPPDEPKNAHAHLIAMMLGNSESIAIHQGQLVLGRYQSILLLEMDGPRDRKVALQILGK